MVEKYMAIPYCARGELPYQSVVLAADHDALAAEKARIEAALLWAIEEWFADFGAEPISIKQSIIESGPFAEILKPIAAQASTTPMALRFDAMKALRATLERSAENITLIDLEPCPTCGALPASQTDRCAVTSVTDGSRCIGPIGHQGAHGFTVDASAEQP